MCGINGVISPIYNKTELAPITKKMNDAMAHRGPNAEGAYSEDGFSFGHRRLSIIDLSEAGTQPMFSNDKRYIIVFNGELYNYLDLKFELQRIEQGTNAKPYVFVTNTDTEVVLAAYIRWGANCLDRFNGMYAFSIFDKETKETIIARDRLGVKPLYYYNKNNHILFASEIRSLLASNVIPRKLNKSAIADYLRYQTVHAPETILEDVKVLMPGHYLKVKNNEIDTYSYWDLQKNINYSGEKQSKVEIEKNIKELFFKSVERRLIADVPFGAFLSGGIDSSAVVAAMANVSENKIETFSVTFGESEYSEAEYAKLISKKFNTNHHEIKLNAFDFLNELPNALDAMDSPSGDGPNTYIVSKATKEAGITMALSGIGGDELFAGYDIFKRSLELDKKWYLNYTPRMFRKIGAEIYRSKNKTIAGDKIADVLSSPIVNFDYSYPISRRVLTDNQILSLTNLTSLPFNSVYKTVRLQAFTKTNYQLTKVSLAEISTYLQNVLLRDTDQMSMANALEVREPFLDYKLVEYSLGINDAHKYPHQPKKLFVDALGDLLPREIIDRPKMGFVFPWEHWMKNELKSFCEAKINSLSNRESFNKSGVLAIWNRFINNDPKINFSRVWLLIVLENWLDKNNIEA